MKNHAVLTVKLLAIALAAAVSCSLLFTIVNTQADTHRDSGTSDSEYNPTDDPEKIPVVDSGEIPVVDSGYVPPVCICTMQCTETLINPLCPVCKAEGGFALCAYTPTLEALLERCDELGAWYDGVIADDPEAVNDKGVLLKQADKEYFFSEYAAIIALADRMTPEVRAKLSESEIFLRLQSLYSAMHGGYIVQYFSNDAALQKDMFSGKKRAALANEDEPSFEQECAPNTVYTYPTMDAAGLPEHPGYVFAGWSDSPDAAEAAYKPGTPFSNLTQSLGSTVNLYGVWAPGDPVSVTLAENTLVRGGGTFGPGKATNAANWTGTITPIAYYKLRTNPIAVTVKDMDTGEYTEITDNPSITCTSAGFITIPKDLITGDIVITAFAVPNSYNVTLLPSPNVRDDGESFGTDKAYFGRAWSGNLLMPGYHLDTNFNKALTIKAGTRQLNGVNVLEITETTTAPTGGFIYTINGDIMIAASEITGNITIQTPAATPAIANKYTIKYDKNGADGTQEMNATPDVRFYNGALTALRHNTFTYTGNQFAGWSRSASTGDVAYNDDQPVNNLTSADNGTVILYAVWKSTGGLSASIQNGSFEKPKVDIHTLTFQDTNTAIKWKTTLPSHKIEIGNAAHQSALNTYTLTRAADGTQFAELNADDVGALYQNIATLPGSKLNWGLAHKCRGTNGAMETMQVWIGSEAQVNEAIRQYKAAGNRVSGVDAATLAAVHQRTISDSYIDAVTWSRSEGAYTVPAGQFITMFAFVSVSDINSSYGNLLDDVYFSALPPPPRTPVTVSTTQGGNVTVTYAGSPVAGLNSSNPSYTGSLENGGILKLYSSASSGYTYNGAFLDGNYIPKTKLGAMSWTVGASMPKNITVLYSKLRTLSFDPDGGAYTQTEKTLGDNVMFHTVDAPTLPGFRFKGWQVSCPDLIVKPGETAKPIAIVGDKIQYVTKLGVTSLQFFHGGTVWLNIPGEQGVNLKALYDAQKTVLTVDPAGGRFEGTANPAAPVKADLSLLNPNWILTSPTRPDYDFDGWKYTANGTTNPKLYPAGTRLTFSVSAGKPLLSVGGDTAFDAPVTITLTAQWNTRDATQPTITAGTPASVTMVYGDGGQSLNVTTGAIPAKHTYSYQWYKNTSNSNTGGKEISGATAASYSIPAKTAAGRSYYYCVVTATRTDTAMSKSATSSAATVTVNPRPVTLDWSTDSFAYDGTEKTVTAAVTDAIGGDTVTVTAYSNNSKTAAGSYTAVATALENANYKFKANPDDRKGWSIGKKTPVLMPDAGSMKLTDETAASKHDEVTFKYSYDGDGTVTAVSDRPDIVVVSTDTATKTVVVRIKNPNPALNGQLSVTLVATEGANYVAATSVPVLLNIQQGKLIGGADGYSGVYDGLPHGIVVKPILDYPCETFYGTSADNCTSPGSPTYRNVGTNTVFYEVRIAPIKDLLPSGMTIKGSKTVVISPAPLTAAYVSESIIFGAAPALKVAVTGFKNGETAAGLGVVAPIVTNSNTLPGVYTLTPASVTGTTNPTANYTFAQYTSGTLTIGSASMAGSVAAADYTGVYDGASHTITVHSPAASTVKYGGSADKCTLAAPTAYKDVGVYTVYYLVSQPGFNDVSGSARVTITKAMLTAAYSPDESVEFGAAPALAVVVSGFAGSDTALNARDYIAPAVVNFDTLPGVYRLTPEGGSAHNYSFRYASGVLTITAKAMPAFTPAADVTAVYDNGFHGISAVNNIPAGAAVTYGTTANNITSSTIPTYQNAGSYTTYYLVSQPGYIDVTGSANVTITQRPVSVTSVNVDKKMYDGTTDAQNPVFTLETATGNRGMLPSDILHAGGTVAFSDKNVGINKNVSVNGVGLWGNDALNYILDTAPIPTTSTAEIIPKPVELSWYYGVLGTVERVYDGKPSNVYAYVSGDLVAGDVCGVKTLNGNQTNAGSHTATADSVDNPNYKLPTGTLPAGHELTQVYINTKAKLTAKCANETITFTPPGAAPGSFPVEVTGFVNGETPTSIGSTDYTAPAGTLKEVWTGAGKYTLIASGGAATNYDFVYVNGTLQVNAGNLHATVTNYIGDYDGKPHGISVVPEAGMPTITTEFYSDSSYAADKKLADEPKYTDVTRTGSDPAVTPVAVYYKLTAPSLTAVTGVAYIQINPKPISVKGLVCNPDDKKRTKPYDGTLKADDGPLKANPIVTAELDGLIPGETPKLKSQIDFASPDAGMNKVVNLTAGTLEDNGTFKKDNYVLSGNPVSAQWLDVGITPKPVTLVWNNGGVTTYTGKAREVTAALAPGELVVRSTGTDTCDVIVTGGDKIDVGKYNATAAATTATTTSLSNSNYALSATSTSPQYEITKAPLTAKYKDETVTFGGKPRLEIEIVANGFVNGESERTAAGYVPPTVAPHDPDPANVPVGTYTLTPAGGSAKNYEFSYADGTLTVVGIDMGAQVTAFGYWEQYDGAPHGITVSKPAGSTVKYYSDEQLTTEITGLITDVEDSPLTVYYEVTKTNYAAVTGSRTVIIRPRQITAAVENVTNDGNAVYNGSDAAKGDIVLRGLIGADSNTVTATCTIRFTDSKAGAAKRVNVTGIFIQNNTKGNYTLESDKLLDYPTNAAIGQKPVELDWNVPDRAGLLYDGTAKKVTATVKAASLVGDDECTVTVIGGAETLAGDYIATAANLSNDNYKLPADAAQLSRSYTIAKAVIPKGEITITPHQGLYDHSLHDAVALTGTKEGDIIRYCIVAAPDAAATDTSNWLSAVPRLGRRNSKLHIVVQVARPNYEVFTADTVTAAVWSAPEVYIAAPQFYSGNPGKVTINGKAENPIKNKYIDYVDLRYRKEGDKRYTSMKNLRTEEGENRTELSIDYTFEGLEPNTLYEVSLTSANWMDEGDDHAPFAEAILHFRTNPVAAPPGTFSGKVYRKTNSTGPIDVTLQRSGRVIASQKNLADGDTFTFTEIADGEYNLTASDEKYHVTDAVTVKNGMAVQTNIEITISANQVLVTSELEGTVDVAEENVKEMFDSPEVKKIPKVDKAIKNDGVAKLWLQIGPGTTDFWQGNPILPAGSKTGITLEVTLSFILTLSGADDMEEDPITIYSTTGKPVELKVELPAEMQNKYDYMVFRSHKDSEEGKERVEKLTSVSVRGSYLYITTDKFSQFVLTYNDKPSGGNGSGGGGGGGGGNSPSSPKLPARPAKVPAIADPSSSASSNDSSASSGGGSASIENGGGASSNDSSASSDPTPDQRDKTTSGYDRTAHGIAAGIDSDTAAAYDETLRAPKTANTDGFGQRPFVLFSAIFSLIAVVLAEITFFRKRGKKQITAAIIFAALAVLMFVLTSGSNDMVLANGYTIIIAALCSGAVAAALHRPKNERTKINFS